MRHSVQQPPFHDSLMIYGFHRAKLFPIFHEYLSRCLLRYRKIKSIFHLSNLPLHVQADSRDPHAWNNF